MTDSPTAPTPEPVPAVEPAPATEAAPKPPHVYPEIPDEPSLVAGRPVEDRAFEVAEGGMGFAAGAIIGTAIAGPIGAVVGGIIGAAGGVIAGERLERAVGPAGEESDATVPEEEIHGERAAEAAEAAETAPAPRTFGYPTNYLLAVAASADGASAATSALYAAGFPGSDVVVVTSETAGHLPAPLASHHRHLAGVMRAVQSASMDQVADLRVYEEALAKGETVVAVHVHGRDRVAAAEQVLESAGLTFLSYFGRWSTAEVTRPAAPEAAADVVKAGPEAAPAAPMA